MAENGLQDDFIECPLCMEPLAFDDINFYPCACRYQICRFCWHRIRTDENGLCPHCREPYSENPAEYTPPTQEQMAKLKSEKKQKTVEKRQKMIESRKSLSSVRVVQKNLVFVIGLSPRLADPEILKKNEYFGKFGRIYKVVINNHTVYNGAQGPSVSAYVTYVRNEDASKAITAVNNAYIDGRYLKASFGTTKYCTSFLRGIQCTKPDCMYLHELGDNDASFTKEDMQLGKHQTYENATLAASNIPPSFKESQPQSQLQQQHSVGGAGGGVKIKHVAHKPTVNDSAESALPATASWGSSVKSVQPAANNSTDSAQQPTSKDTKTNVSASHSHSVGVSKHKHQQLVKSHSHSPSHGTGHGSSSQSRANKIVKESTSHHSRSRSGPLSPTHSNEQAVKKQNKSHSHGRSGSTGKSTPSLSPKSTLSGSSSSGSIKHDVDVSGDCEVKGVSEEMENGANSLNTSKEDEGGEEEREEDGETHVEKDKGEEGEGGWCQINEPTDPLKNEPPPALQNESEQSEENGAESENASVMAEGEEREEKECLTTASEDPSPSELTTAPSVAPPPTVPTVAPPPTNEHQQSEEEDSSIVQVIPSLVSGGGQFGALGVSWNTPLPQQTAQAVDAPTQPEETTTPTSPTHTEDDLGFDPWDVSQQGLADLMKSEQEQRNSLPSQPAVGHAHQPSLGHTHQLTNGVGNGTAGSSKSTFLQEEFKALFPNVNVSFEGSNNLRSVGSSSDSLISTGLPLSAKAAAPPTSTATYIPSRLDSALSSTYHPLLGASPITPITSSSSSAPSGSLKMFLGQHQPGFPSSSIKVHSRLPEQSVGSKLGTAEWPDLGVSITPSKPPSAQWTASTGDTADTKVTAAVTSGNATSSLPPPPPGFSAKTTPTTTSSIPGTAVSSNTIRAPGTTLNNTVNHSLWAGGGANVKGNITGNHLLQSWANFMKFSSLTPAQQGQLARGSQIFQQLLLQQQYLIRQSLLIQSNPYYQAHAQALAQAQATLQAQLQQNILRQQQIAAAMAAAGQKIVNSATSTSTSSTSIAPTSNGSVPLSQGSSQPPAVGQHSTIKTLPAAEGVKNSNHRVTEATPHLSTHTRPHGSQQVPSSAKQSSTRTQSSVKVSKNSVGGGGQASAGSADRKSVRLKAK